MLLCSNVNVCDVFVHIVFSFVYIFGMFGVVWFRIVMKGFVHVALCDEAT